MTPAHIQARTATPCHPTHAAPRGADQSLKPQPTGRPLLTGKHILITGVVDDASIATSIARECIAVGADVTLSAPPRDVERANDIAEALDVDLVELDVNDPEAWQQAARTIGAETGVLHGAVHAVAFAPRAALDGSILDSTPTGLDTAFLTSVASYAWLARLLRDLAPPSGASLVGLDFDASRAWPTYNWMGVCKAALEAANQYVARDLAPFGIRSNLVAAGPLRTRAASAIPGFDLLVDAWSRQAPLAWDPCDAAPVAEAVTFLLSEASRSTTGSIVHVDGGFHAMATSLPAARRAPAGTDRPLAPGVRP